MDQNKTTQEEIMTLQEIARYLKISEKTVQRMVQRGDIPVVKISSQWRFMKALIDDWLLSRVKHPVKPAVTRMIEQSEVILPLSRIARPEHIILNIVPGPVESVLRQLSEPLLKEKVIVDGEEYIGMLVDRENMASTALSNGVALPHARNPSCCDITEPSIVIGICRIGTHFNALDRKNTRLFFLLCTDSDIVHLKIMSKIAFLIKDQKTIEALIDSKNEREVIAILEKVDEEIISNE